MSEFDEREQTLMERAEKAEALNRELVEACRKTIEENLHLADGDICTLIHIKRVLASASVPAKGKP